MVALVALVAAAAAEANVALATVPDILEPANAVIHAGLEYETDVLAASVIPYPLIVVGVELILDQANPVIQVGLEYEPLLYTPLVTVPALPVILVVNVEPLLANC